MAKKSGKVKAKKRKAKRLVNKKSHDAYISSLLSKIKKYDDVCLLEKCEEVLISEDFTAQKKLKNTMKQIGKVLAATKNGVGLAAPQIGIMQQIIALRPDSRRNDIIFMINPFIEKHSEEQKYGQEGCLSYPGVFGFVKRYSSITVNFWDEDLKFKTKSYKEGEIEGIIIQHEIEHLQEGHCSLYDWWKNPKEKKQQLKEEFESQEALSANEVVESEDFKREKAEAEASACCKECTSKVCHRENTEVIAEFEND
ncbi:MAG: peptide deformylase [Clostridiales bacterium]|nr:peptide deformylase [Clostridiales bacterium]